MQNYFRTRVPRWLGAAAILLAVTACGEVHDERLAAIPVSDRDFAKFSERLQGEEMRLFNSWQVRMRAGQPFIGEVTPSTVRLAIANQQIYEREQAQKAEAAEQERQAALRQEAFVRLSEIKEGLLDAEINARFLVSSREYDTKPSFNKNGDYVGVNFSINLILKNKHTKPVRSVAGFIYFYDPRGVFLGRYGFVAEDPVPGKGETVTPVAMLLSSKQQNHQALQQGQRLNIKWRLNELIYEGGERIDMNWMERSGRFINLRP